MVDLLLRQAVLSSLGLDNGNKEEVSEDESLGADLEEYYLPPRLADDSNELVERRLQVCCNYMNVHRNCINSSEVALQ